jgi:hypothetical protein
VLEAYRDARDASEDAGAAADEVPDYLIFMAQVSETWSQPR